MVGTIRASGQGSGLDIESIVTSLVAAERTPAEARFNLRETRVTASISAFGNLKGALEDFQGAVNKMENISDFQARKASSGDTSLFTVSATSTAAMTSYDIDVQELAASQKLVSGDYATADAEIGSGTLSISVGAESFDISVINSTNGMKLSTIRDQINEAPENTGVTASILTVSDGAGGTVSKLVLSSDKTGLENKITVTADDDDGVDDDAAGLSQLIYVEGGPNNGLSELDEAKDARIAVDGFLAYSSDNTFDSVIEGVTINAIKKDPGNTNSLTISSDTSLAKKNITTFVESFNALSTLFNYLTDFDADKNQAGLLTGDPIARLIETQIRRVISNPVESISSGFNTLASLGVKTGEKGALVVDQEQLDKAISNNFESIGEVFASEDGLSSKIDGIISGLVASNGILKTRTTTLEGEVKSINEQRAKLNVRLTSIEDRYRAKFSNLDIIMASLTSTENFLKEQLAVNKQNNQ